MNSTRKCPLSFALQTVGGTLSVSVPTQASNQTLVIGLMLRRSIQTTKALALPLLIIAVLAHSPHIISGALAPPLEPDQAPSDPSIPFQLLDALLAQLLSAAVAYLVIQNLRGTRVGLVQVARVVSSHMFLIVSVGLISQITVLLMTLEPLLSIPGIVLTTMLFVSLPIAVVEQPGIAESLKRSVRLTAGKRWNILGLLGSFVLFTLVANQLLRLIFAVEGDALPAGYLSALSVYRAVLAVFGSVVAAVTYQELRRLNVLAFGSTIVAGRL